MEHSKLSPDDFVNELARRSNLTLPQARLFLQAQAEMAYEHASNGCPVPGVGIVQVIEVPAKMFQNKFGPRKGETVQMPARRKLTFRFTEAAKASLIGRSGKIANVFEVDWYPPEETDLES